MVLESPMNIIGDQSPHMSSMEGDVAKIDSIRSTPVINNSHGNNARDTSESREIGNTPVLSVISHNVSALSPNSQGETIFREPLDSWSRVVVGAGSPPPRSISGETLVTSNAQHAHHHQVLHERSISFPENSSGDQAKFTPAFVHSHSWGMSHFHPAPPQAALATIQQGVEATSTPLNSPMLHAANAQFKNYSAVTYSPLSIGESTGQTSATSLSPMSLSPHASPYVNPRSSGSSPSPPPWVLDANELHPEPPTMRHNLHSRPPQSLNLNSGTLLPKQQSPQESHRHPHSSNTAHRTGPKPHSSSNLQVPLHQRSSTEVLKTLLRKKACLYEPDTSHSISLVTWLVGRRLALSQGYFTRQQLQLGVHSCVAKKIDEGIVTRTKVNRCMQIILNSCFHYIIPRPDGSEENGEAFRLSFTSDAADDEHLLGTLPAPWNNLSLESLASSESDLFNMSDDEGDEKRKRKERSDSLTSHDSGGEKRSVLLCFNENVCSSSDVFHCHNEFIRDVAHTANLSLSPEEWQSFFTGSRAFRKRHSNGDSFESGYSRMSQQSLSSFRTSWCAKRYEHDHTVCGFAHPEINRGWLRRNSTVHKYKPLSCPNIKPLPGKEGCFINMCPRGIACEHAHSNEEIIYHPDNYKRLACKNSANSCPFKDVCPRVHTKQDMPHHHPHGYHRHGRRRHDNSPSQRPRSSSDAARTSGFGKTPEGSPMLYIDPAPLSEFEKTLLLPGLQAMFRDHSSSIFYSNKTNGTLYEYGLFGYTSKKSS